MRSRAGAIPKTATQLHCDQGPRKNNGKMEKECILLENDGTLSDLSKKADEAIQILKNKFPFRF